MIRIDRSREGGISLFLTIVMVAVLFLELVLIGGAKQRDLELRAGRAVDLATDSVLASYDRNLAKQYGLLGFSRAELSASVQAHIDAELVAYPATSELSFSSSDPLSEAAVLEGQISSYMKLLYPQLMIEQILEMSNVLADFKGGIIGASESGTLIDEFEIDKSFSLDMQIHSLLQNHVLKESLNSLNDFLQNQEDSNQAHIFRNYFLQEAAGHEGEEPYEPPLSNENQAIGDDLLDNIVSSADGLNWDLAGLAEQISQGIEILDIDTHATYDRLLTCEYILEMTGNWSDQRQAAKLTEGRKNLRGLSFKQFHHERELESEYILSGLDSELASKAAISALLSGSRLALRALGLLMNEGEMQKLSIWSGILSVGIAIVSGGSIVIEPDGLKYILLLLRAQVEAVSDQNKLLDGGEVDLLPYIDGGDLPSKYSDYLRLFLLVTDKDAQLLRLGETIEGNLGETFYTGLRTTLTFTSDTMAQQNFTLVRCASYDSSKVRMDDES